MSRSCHLVKVQSLEINQAMLISVAVMSPFTLFINLANSLEDEPLLVSHSDFANLWFYITVFDDFFYP